MPEAAGHSTSQPARPGTSSTWRRQSTEQRRYPLSRWREARRGCSDCRGRQVCSAAVSPGQRRRFCRHQCTGHVFVGFEDDPTDERTNVVHALGWYASWFKVGPTLCIDSAPALCPAFLKAHGSPTGCRAQLPPLERLVVLQQALRRPPQKGGLTTLNHQAPTCPGSPPMSKQWAPSSILPAIGRPSNPCIPLHDCSQDTHPCGAGVLKAMMQWYAWVPRPRCGS